jgi:hypothetical protein
MAMTHATTHAVKSAAAGFTAPATTDAVHRACVALANASAALAVHAAAFAMDAGAFTMDCLSILGMQRGLGRAMCIAHDSAEVKPVVVSNFTPALASLVHCYDVVEALARCISQQVGIL